MLDLCLKRRTRLPQSRSSDSCSSMEASPPKAVVTRLRTVAHGSDGSEYEDVLAEALKELNVGKVIPLGHRVAGQRYTDIVWEVPIIE